MPDKRPFPEALQSIGNHIKLARLQRKILIKEVIQRLNINRETLRSWEMEVSGPYVWQYPKIIEFLGYNPLNILTDTLPGKIKMYRHVHGLTMENFAKLLKTDRATVWQWESNNREPIPLMKKRILAVVSPE